MEKVWLKSYESHVPPSIVYPPVPLYQLMDDAAKKYPNNTAIIYGGVVHQLGGALMDAKMTFQQLQDITNRFAAALQGLGVKKGDRVALFLPNCPQFPIAYYATLKAGGIVVPCNPLYVARELEHQVNDAGAETIVVLSRFYPIVKQIQSHTKLKNVIVTNAKEYFPGLLKTLFTLAVEKKEGHRVDITGEANTYWFQDLLAKAPATPQPVDVKPQDTAVLLYTGGTTGVPKGAELSHRNIVANAVQCKHWIGAREGQETTVTSLPLFHSYGMTTCMNLSMYIGGAMLLIPNPRDLDHILKAINKHHPTMFPGVPTMYVAINNHPDVSKYNLKSIRACVSGAAGLPVDVQKKFQELTGGRLVEGYGLSETSPVTHANPIFGNNKIGTIGVPWPDTEAKIIDLETGTKEMPLGETGELVIRGPQVMKGYWNMPDETKNTLRDGWLYTGDIARMDQDGYFQIVDRKKDMIIAGGFNIYPRDVEEVLYRHPKVKEVVVAGVPDIYRGETVKAYIVLKEGQTATAEEIIDFCRQNLAKFKVPTAVEFRDSLPKTMVGKILRRMLVEEEKKKLAEKK
jgi:long-chain acyl-CoA synthetase